MATTTTTIRIEKSDDLLVKIEDFSNLAKTSGFKSKGDTLRDAIDNLLDVLDDLIRLSADRFMSLGDIDHDDIEEEEYEQYIVHPNDIIRAKGYSSAILLKLISAEILFEDDKDEERMERASRLLAHMSGRGGTVLKFVYKIFCHPILTNHVNQLQAQSLARGTFRTWTLMVSDKNYLCLFMSHVMWAMILGSRHGEQHPWWPSKVALLSLIKPSAKMYIM